MNAPSTIVRFIMSACAVVIVVGTAPAAEPEGGRTYRLKYSIIDDPDVQVTAMEMARFPSLEEIKKCYMISQATKPPSVVSSNPWYCQILLPKNGSDQKYKEPSPGENAFFYAIDESKGTGTGYDTFIIDANRNFDLSDDKAHRGVRSGSMMRFKPIELRLPYKVRLRPYHIKPRVMAEAGAAALEPAGWRRGKIELAGRLYEIALIDDNGVNCFFNDYFNPNPPPFKDGKGDVLLIDINGDGRFERVLGTPSPEAFELSRILVFNGESYSLDVSPLGDTIAVKPASSAGENTVLSGARARTDTDETK